MSSKFQWLLALILLFQIGWIYWSHTKDLSVNGAQRFVTLNPDQISEIRIRKPDQAVLEISRNENQWILAEAGNQPADEKQIQEFLSRLLSIQSSWPIAQTQSAQEQFQVGENNYLAKIDLISDSRLLTTIFLGRSPGINTTYARLADQDEIYRIAFKLLDLSAQAKDWKFQDIAEIVSEQVPDNQSPE
ncbi:MAG: DUF4340 domain-containing protein [Gammaproteobacteria bacterium]|nr:DUF4340 domain-containing protein [Gammaproteobacteria bacterium]